MEHKENCARPGQKHDQGTKLRCTFLPSLNHSVFFQLIVALGRRCLLFVWLTWPLEGVPHTMKPRKVENWKESEKQAETYSQWLTGMVSMVPLCTCASLCVLPKRGFLSFKFYSRDILSLDGSHQDRSSFLNGSKAAHCDSEEFKV